MGLAHVAQCLLLPCKKRNSAHFWQECILINLFNVVVVKGSTVTFEYMFTWGGIVSLNDMLYFEMKKHSLST